MRRGLLLLIVFILAMGVASAAYTGISIKELSSSTIIEPEEVGTYTLEITNIGSKNLQLQLSADPYAGLPSSDFEYLFIDPNYIVLEGHETAEINVTLKLYESVLRQKRYKTYFRIESLNSDDVDETYDLQLFAMPVTDPIALYVADEPGEVAAGSDMLLALGLKNNLDEDLNNVEIYVTSDLFEEQETIQLFEDQERTVEFTIAIPSTAAPEDYTFSARVYYDDELQSTVSGEFTVGVNLDVSQTVELEDNFLNFEILVTKINNGNTIVTESYVYDLGLIQSWFTDSSIEPSYTDEEGTHWTFNVEPGESYQLYINVDYRPAIIGLVVILLAVLMGYYLFTRRVVIKKEISKKKFSVEGLSDFQVQLHIKNRTSKPIKDITIIDMLPKIIKPTTQFGTLQPSGVQRGPKGLRMMWKISELVGGEERIISYNVKPNMSVIGRLNLPQALVKYKSNSKKIRKIKSNRSYAYSGVPEEEEEKNKRRKKNKR